MRPRLPAILSLIVVLLSVGLIVSTYLGTNQTWDETAHLGTGMEWLSRGTYSLDMIDPPLPRISVAAGPYLLGSRSAGLSNPWDEGDRILVNSGHILRTLAAARLGILFYFIIACFLTWSITSRWLGQWPAFLATALFATCPPVLAHASVATTDMCFLATYLWALDRLWLALRIPSRLNYLLVGTAFGLACLSKLSAGPFLFTSGGVILLYSWWKHRKFGSIPAYLLFLASYGLTLWAGYHFSIGPMMRTHETLSQLERFGPLGKAAFQVVEHFPAYQFPQGIHQAAQMSKSPPDGYMFGRTYVGGVWYFYLVILLIKTPLPFLLLVLPGIVLACAKLIRRQDEFVLLPLCGIVFPILIATESHINLGVRHVLVVYPFFAMLASLFAVELYRRVRLSTRLVPACLGGLLAWQAASSIFVAPDFLTYLNEPAAPYSAFLCADSDFDWGQDLSRLPVKLNELHASPGWIAYSGSALPSDFGMGQWKKLEFGQPQKGWIAVSENYLRKYPASFAWLTSRQPVAEAGKTIRIYDIQ